MLIWFLCCKQCLSLCFKSSIKVDWSFSGLCSSKTDVPPSTISIFTHLLGLKACNNHNFLWFLATLSPVLPLLPHSVALSHFWLKHKRTDLNFHSLFCCCCCHCRQNRLISAATCHVFKLKSQIPGYLLLLFILRFCLYFLYTPALCCKFSELLNLQQFYILMLIIT